MPSNYQYLGVTPETLESGRPLAFGDEVNLTQQAVDANKRLISEGTLVEVKPTKEKS